MNIRAAIGIVIAVLIILGSYKAGATIESARWLQRENKLQLDAAAKLKDAEDRVIAGERAHAQHIADISSDYERKLMDQSRAAAAAVSDLHNRNVRLSVTARTCSGNTAAETNTGTGRSDATARCELSDEAAGFLISEAKRADAVVLQLTACQAVVVEDRIPR